MEKKFVMHFPPVLVDKPIISTIVRKYNLDFNILKAFVSPEEEGTLVIAFSGGEKDVNSAVSELKDEGVKIQMIESDIKMIRERCTDCSVCVGLCPVGALMMDKDTYEVKFTPEKCIACELCIRGCPTKAMVSTI
ncbi:MAG: 4Fe-4S binding protein [Candidatus Omnitrophica bacterium]|nr:4Fe-4S binding protein [Candidatus Omnitrophota bacterium]MCM8777771.1 4Fe-4S binding protein [Candidatus Omnitrophota bacterium]